MYSENLWYGEDFPKDHLPTLLASARQGRQWFQPDFGTIMEATERVSKPKRRRAEDFQGKHRKKTLLKTAAREMVDVVTKLEAVPFQPFHDMYTLPSIYVNSDLVLIDE